MKGKCERRKRKGKPKEKGKATFLCVKLLGKRNASPRGPVLWIPLKFQSWHFWRFSRTFLFTFTSTRGSFHTPVPGSPSPSAFPPIPRHHRPRFDLLSVLFPINWWILMTNRTGPFECTQRRSVFFTWSKPFFFIFVSSPNLLSVSLSLSQFLWHSSVGTISGHNPCRKTSLQNFASKKFWIYFFPHLLFLTLWPLVALVLIPRRDSYLNADTSDQKMHRKTNRYQNV